jgi:hypothetical protein
MRRSNGLVCLCLVACLGFVLAACGGMVEEPLPERGRTVAGGKADTTGTCKDACGGQSLDGCWCDSKCATFGDCCTDKGQVCVKNPVKDPCWGAWLDQFGNCRTPSDGVYPDSCCKGQFCGGIAGIKCPLGFQCKLKGTYPDAGGTCVKCQPVLCELYCQHGFKTDANGCGVCACAEPPRKPASGMCIKNSNDSCSTDADCVAGGCGGELCYNPTFGGGASTCECTQPTGVSCGCVNGKCNWWN